MVAEEVKNFTAIPSSTILTIARNPEVFEASKYRKDIRKGFITKHTCLLYSKSRQD